MSREETFGSISLIGRGVPIQGALKMSGAGISWKKAGGGRSVEVVTRTSLRVPKPLTPLTIREDIIGRRATTT